MLFEKISNFFSRNKNKNIEDLLKIENFLSEEELHNLEDIEIVKRKRSKYEAEGLVVNSVNEEYLYLMLQECSCGSNYPKDTLISQTLQTQGNLAWDIIKNKCKGCGAEKSFKFDISRFYGDIRLYSKGFNPFDRPSSVIDVFQWADLAYFNLKLTEKYLDESAGLLANSLEFIDEALKFYRPGSPYPPDESYFNKPRGIEITDEIKNMFSIERIINIKTEIEEKLQKCNS
jgi:hypothetical protein